MLATHIASTITIVEFLKKVLVVSLQVVRKEHLSISNYFRISASVSLNQHEKPHTILHIILRLIIFLVFYWLRFIAFFTGVVYHKKNSGSLMLWEMR